MEGIIIPNKRFLNGFLTFLQVVDSIFALKAVAALGADLTIGKAFTIELQAFAFFAVALEL